ncbi:autotransporter outer membrane beta-barrel domain-containing protein [Snodgrassella alvi]|uniref:autotransporter outer membrane beta-barrel domain-containing protein n=1 Tax=Snodgrassella alvi TaxID=1196083 RepID=UPI0035B411A8
MNNIYKSKWSEATQTWVACSELVRGKTKNNCVKIAAAVVFAVTSISSYAAGCNVTGGTNPNIVQTAANGECKLDPSDSTEYNKISVSDTKLTTEGKIVATGPASGVNQKTIILNNAIVEANTIETTNRRLKYTSNALASSNSKVTTSGDLTAHNSGNNAIIISSQDGSEFNIGGNLNIDDNGSMIAIDNSESIIKVTGDITIKGKDTSSNNRNSAISNQGGTITAQNINIEQGKGNTVISQTSGSNPDEPGLININEDLNIKTEASGPGSSAIEINGGTIKIGGNTNITMTTESDPDVKSSAIIVENGTYDTQGDTAIHINKDGTTELDTETTGVLMSDNSEFSTNGKLEVNDGDNTVITTNDSLTEQATFNNNKNATTRSSVDTIVHQGSGTLNIKNDGTLISTAALSPNKTDKSVIRNKAKGSIEVNNEATGKIFGNINNDSLGEINITNDGLINNGSINNNDAGIITLNNNNSGKIASDILNGGTGTITVNNKDSASTIAGNITNTKDGNIAINNSGKTDSSKKITNSNAGKIDIINTESGSFESAIDNDATSTGMITLDNQGTVNSNITNKNTGAIKITNDNTLSGSITNTGYKVNENDPDNIVIDNNHILNSTIKNERKGVITLNNNNLVNSDITNKNTGAIKITNENSLNGSITNTGGKGTADNIVIDNNHILNSTIKNDGSGTIVVNNNKASSSINGDITNSKDGNIAINNSGTANSSKITNSNAGKINIINTAVGDFQSAIDNDATSTGMIILDNQGTVDSTITNKNTGAIKITNTGTLGGSIKNTGNASTAAANNIDITNNNVLNSDINNDGKGTIALNNNGSVYSNITNTGDKIDENTANILIDNKKNLNGNINNDSNGSIVVNNTTVSSVINGNITNTKDGNITLDNKGTFDGYIKNKGTGSLSLTNDNTVSGYIENNGTGRISITNDGTINGSITNTGTQRVVGNNWIDNIWIDNNKELKSNIENLNGSIVVNNNKEGSSFTGNIYNNNGFNTGKITVNNNEENTKINSHITNDNGDITINNKAKTSTIEGDITNINGSVKIKNSGEANYSKITNSGGHLNIDNEHEGNFQGDIDNDATGTGFIYIQNSGNTFNGSITNQNTGNIRIINDKIFNSKITNTGDFAVDAYNIKITNNKELNGPIENNGRGSIYIENTKDTGRIRRIRRITGNITNNNAGTITLDNNGEIASAILNGGAGAINIENNKDSFINGNITNSGAGNISIKNQDQAVLNGNIKNNGSGSITFTNNGDVDANVVNNTSVRINDTSLRQIQNTGNGTIIIINNKTLNRPISNASDGTIGITNNGTMETDITNNTESSEGGITFKNKQKFTGKLINANSGSIFADNQGIWNNTGNSVLTNLQNTTGTIIFPQVFETNAGDKGLYHTITVNGNYTGGGQIYVNTVWNKDGTSYSDRIDIHGDVDGAPTTVRTLNGIYGDVTLKEIPIHSAVVVHVAGKSSGNDFTGSAPTTNAGEAQLKKIDSISGTDYAWTLTAQNKTPEPTNPGVSEPTDPTVSEPTDPDKPILPAPPITEVPIYAEPVSGYVQMPTADMELGFTTIGTLHERRGENQTYNITGSNNTALGGDQQQTWGRVLVKHLDKDGKKRLDTAGNQSVLQIGHDFILDENEKTGIRRHIGGYVAYGHNENDFRDEYRAKNGYIVDDHYTGKGRTDAISVGGYGTFYGNNGGYVDLVGQVTYLRNKYNARSNESVHQNGWGAALSAETGKSFIVYGNNWFVEPQAQLVYQYLSLDDFNDRIRHVDQHDPSALRGRVGMRFGYNGDIRDNLPSSSFYGIANIWHDFVNPKSVDIGRDNLKEEYAKTWGEVGLGIQLPITRQSNFYSDIRYEKNFGSDKRKGFKGTIGYKYTWL